MGKGLKYLLVAKYLVPKAFIEDYAGRPPPEDDGTGVLPGLPGASDKGKDPKPLVDTLLDEDKGSDEQVVKDMAAIEVMIVPTISGLLLDGEPGDELDYDYSEPDQEDKEEEEEYVTGEVDVVMKEGDCEAPEMTYLTFGTALPNNQAITVRRALQDVYVPATEGESEKFLHTLHVRADLVDPGAPDLIVSLDPGSKPRRRVQGKTSAEVVEMRAVTKISEEISVLAIKEAERLLEEWDVDEAYSLVVELARSGFFADKKFGAYRHGGAVGQMTGLVEYPAMTRLLNRELARSGFFADKKFGAYRHGGAVGQMTGLVEYPAMTRLLNRILVESCPDATFTSVLVSCNTPKAMHRDVNNDYLTMNHVLPLVVPKEGGELFTSVLVSCNTPKAMHRDVNNDYLTMNHVLPLVVPKEGGELWIELKEGDVVRGQIEQRKMPNGHLYGQLRLLHERDVIEFSPKRFHEVMDWVGERIVVIAYTPNCLGKLPQEDLLTLHQHDFPVPISQLPEFNGDSEVERPFPRMNVMTCESGEPAGEEDLAGDVEQERTGWVMYLDLEPGLVKIAEDDVPRELPRVQKAEVGFTKNIEKVLQNLTGPLDVVHNVNPHEVMSNLEAWRPAIMKEVKGIGVAIEKLIPGSATRRRWLNNPRAQRLPMKFVFTIKPTENARVDEPDSWYKRKARLVPFLGWIQIIGFCGLIDFGLYRADPSRDPGDYENAGILGVPNASGPMADAEGRKRKLNSELANGRLAMECSEPLDQQCGDFEDFNGVVLVHEGLAMTRYSRTTDAGDQPQKSRLQFS
eukprot:s3111_g3.t1